MKYDAIIFDLDGTIWNSCASCAKGWTNALKKLGIDKEITPEQIESVAGLPFKECVETLLPKEYAEIEELPRLINEGENEVIREEGGKFYDGVINRIKHLAGFNKVYLVSNCQTEYLDLFFKLSGIKDLFTDYNCNETSGLPKGEMLINMRKKHDMKNPVYIGDTLGDKEAAEQAGMAFMMVENGFTKSHPDLISP